MNRASVPFALLIAAILGLLANEVRQARATTMGCPDEKTRHIVCPSIQPTATITCIPIKAESDCTQTVTVPTGAFGCKSVPGSRTKCVDKWQTNYIGGPPLLPAVGHCAIVRTCTWSAKRKFCNLPSSQWFNSQLKTVEACEPPFKGSHIRSSPAKQS